MHTAVSRTTSRSHRVKGQARNLTTSPPLAAQAVMTASTHLQEPQQCQIHRLAPSEALQGLQQHQARCPAPSEALQGLQQRQVRRLALLALRQDQVLTARLFLAMPLGGGSLQRSPRHLSLGESLPLADCLQTILAASGG